MFEAFNIQKRSKQCQYRNTTSQYKQQLKQHTISRNALYRIHCAYCMIKQNLNHTVIVIIINNLFDEKVSKVLFQNLCLS